MTGVLSLITQLELTSLMEIALLNGDIIKEQTILDNPENIANIGYAKKNMLASYIRTAKLRSSSATTTCVSTEHYTVSVGKKNLKHKYSYIYITFCIFFI